MNGAINKKDEVFVFSEDNCPACEKVLAVLKSALEDNNSVEMKIFNRDHDISTFEKYRVFILPAVFINGKLQFYGEFQASDLNHVLTTSREV